MSQFNDTGTRMFTAGAAIKLWARVKLASGTVTEAGIADKHIGYAMQQAFASGDIIAVRLFSKEGTHKAIAAAAITQGNEVFTAAAGKVSVSASTAFRFGVALETATADLDIIEVLHYGMGDTAVP